MSNRTNFGEPTMGAYRLKEMHEAQFPQGVVVDPTPITAGQDILVFYDGLLAKDGAQEVYLHCGFGNSENWSTVQDYRMAKTGYGFVKTMSMPDNHTQFSFCFHDNAMNWDNNSGKDWVFQVHDGTMNGH
ncbi:carbohydrate-binding protein [Desulfotomaculum defluvii]